MKTLISKEWGVHGHRVQGVVVCELSQGQEVSPVVLLIIDVHPEELLQNLIDSFGLAISLWMVGC